MRPFKLEDVKTMNLFKIKPKQNEKQEDNTKANV